MELNLVMLHIREARAVSKHNEKCLMACIWIDVDSAFTPTLEEAVHERKLEASRTLVQHSYM